MTRGMNSAKNAGVTTRPTMEPAMGAGGRRSEMLKTGFLRFCDNPEIACCKAERELEQLRSENALLRKRLADSQRSEQAAVNDLQKSIKFYALGTCICGLCLKHSCNEFCYGKSWEWRGPQEAGEVEADDD